jgi:hypothetical protein
MFVQKYENTLLNMLLSCFAVQRIKSELQRTIDSDKVYVEEKLVSVR